MIRVVRARPFYDWRGTSGRVDQLVEVRNLPEHPTFPFVETVVGWNEVQAPFKIENLCFDVDDAVVVVIFCEIGRAHV